MRETKSSIFKLLIVISFTFGVFFLMPNFVKETHAEVAPCAVYGIH